MLEFTITSASLFTYVCGMDALYADNMLC